MTMKGLGLVLLLAAVTLALHLHSSNPFIDTHCPNVFAFTKTLRKLRTPPSTGHAHSKPVKSTILLLLLLASAGDIHSNPGPRTASIYPCGMCERKVSWSDEGVACDQCDVWYHRSCMDLCSKDYSLLSRSKEQWLCCRCDTINVSSFTFWQL